MNLRTFNPQGWLIVAGASALALLALAWAVLAWGQARYDTGVRDADARWVAAAAKLERQARAAGTSADAREADRIKDHTAAVADEKEKIDEAIATGRSPLDALFGGL